MVDLKDADRYFKHQKDVKREVLTQVKKDKGIIYGAQALNQYLPRYLEKKTEDYDIFSRNPEPKARRLERRLDKHYGANLFETIPADHPGTYKVKNRITGKTVADYTQPEGRIPSRTKQGVRYVTLNFIQRGIYSTLKDETAKYRHHKDKDSLIRLKINRMRRR